ncbi:uncharacterized protein LOC131150330 [Malania oleifera]|uniref:uncharacterized protein LOC131150330 n=1 Tax=Malania oleifera TaxID=397392 RepID=UPI0025AE647F|nr:uncharacterized protein LOC131150330 [Malania oleifera]
MAYKHVQKLLYAPLHLNHKPSGVWHYHYSKESHEEILPSDWYVKAFPKITRLSHQLKDVDLIDGRLVYIDDNSRIIDDQVKERMYAFKSLARAFLGSASMQESLNNVMSSSAGGECSPVVCFNKQIEREPITIKSLTKVCHFLNISAQQRKFVRLTICPQVTQHRVWTGALEEILRGLKSDMESLNHQLFSQGTQMGHQILSSCLKFLDDKAISYDPDSTSWMRLAPAKIVDSPANKWEEVLDMFNDLIKSLRNEEELQFHVSKLEVMKEGLAQIKDVLIDRNIGYKEARHQESLVQKKLSKTLGHSSRCLFTLLQYYLCGSITDIEVEICGGVYGVGMDRYCLCMGRILTSNQEKMVLNGVKQLDRALGLFKFIWETARMKGVLELQGHLWCVGAEKKTIAYKGNKFFVHAITL